MSDFTIWDAKAYRFTRRTSTFIKKPNQNHTAVSKLGLSCNNVGVLHEKGRGNAVVHREQVHSHSHSHSQQRSVDKKAEP